MPGLSHDTNTDSTDRRTASHREQIIEGLVNLAAFLETNPAVPVARFAWTLNVSSSVSLDSVTDLRQRAEIDRVAELLNVPVSDATAEGGHYLAQRHFGPITYEVTHIPARWMAEYYARQSHRNCVAPALDDDRPVPSARRWSCCSCGGGGVASDGGTCPDCDGYGHY